MNIHEIMSLVPHRYPFLLIDKVIEFIPGKSIIAIKNVTANEPFFAGHFPNNPVMPGVIILEALAQASGILAYKAYCEDKSRPKSIIYFAGIDHARFKRIVVPGDQLRLEAEIVRVKQDIWKCKALASVDDQIACSAELLAARKDISSDS
jgi:3-hydroxyacyl-[acyl-carrier-protein] dehydratase